MDKEEILRRQQEGFRLRRELGDQEYRKIKAKRRREYYDKMQEDAKKALGEDYRPVQNPVRIETKAKPIGTSVGIIVVDESGEHVFMWNAPNLKGTMMPAKQNIQGYKEAVFDAFQKAFGRLAETK
jgi:hypothetical protein